MFPGGNVKSVSSRLDSFVHQVLDHNGDGQLDGWEASPAQLKVLLSRDLKEGEQSASVADVVAQARLKGGEDPAKLARHFCGAFKNSSDNYIDLSAKGAALLGRKLGLTFRECRVLAADFEKTIVKYLGGCQLPQKPTFESQRPTSAEAVNAWTLSNYRETPVKHIDLDLTIDFVWRTFRGTAAYTLGEYREPKLILDTRSIEVNRVWVVPKGKTEQIEVSSKWGEAKGILGRPLIVEFPPDTQVEKVIVQYQTDIDTRSPSITWLDPQQTATGKHPFVFTQSAPHIYARGWLPVQDTPASRVTMSQKLRVKHDPKVVALMSNTNQRGSIPRPKREGDMDVWSYSIESPVPAYFVAIAVGELSARKIGGKSVIYAEPRFIDAAAREYRDVERYRETAEHLFGPIPYGLPDTLIPPPSFVYGGMENLGVNFDSTTVLTGDGSALWVPVHEFGHNYFGNKVTYFRAEDMWLIEAGAMYFQRLVSEKVFGLDKVSIEAVNGRSLLDRIHLDPVGESQNTCLATKFPYEDPVDGINNFIYQKTYLFMDALERKIGRKKFVAFLRAYVERFGDRAVTTQDFVNFWQEYTGRPTSELDEWLYGPGLPEEAQSFSSVLLDQANAMLQQWQTGRYDIPNVQSWRPEMWVFFLQRLAGGPKLEGKALDELRATHRLDELQNPEIRAYWYALVAKHGYRPSYPGLLRYLDGSVGRVKYLQRVFAGLAEGDKESGLKIYRELRPKLHPFAWTWLDGLTGYTKATKSN